MRTPSTAEIDEAHNWCDRWCERCSLADRCSIGRSAGVTYSRPAMVEVAGVLERALEMLEVEFAKQGLDIEEAEPRVVAEGTDELAKRALSWTHAGARWLKPLRQPGAWQGRDGVQIDLMVPEALSGRPGHRGADLGVHGHSAARQTKGLEATLVDKEIRAVASFEADDIRVFEIAVGSDPFGNRSSAPRRSAICCASAMRSVMHTSRASIADVCHNA